MTKKIIFYLKNSQRVIAITDSNDKQSLEDCSKEFEIALSGSSVFTASNGRDILILKPTDIAAIHITQSEFEHQNPKRKHAYPEIEPLSSESIGSSEKGVDSNNAIDISDLLDDFEDLDKEDVEEEEEEDKVQTKYVNTDNEQKIENDNPYIPHEDMDTHINSDLYENSTDDSEQTDDDNDDNEQLDIEDYVNGFSDNTDITNYGTDDNEDNDSANLEDISDTIQTIKAPTETSPTKPQILKIDKDIKSKNSKKG